MVRAVEPSRDAAPVGQYDSLLSFGFQIGNGQQATRWIRPHRPGAGRRRRVFQSRQTTPVGRRAISSCSSWPGRLFIVAVIFKILILVARLFGEVPAFLQVLSTAATVALAFSVLFFLTRLVFLVQRRLLWRVRRKLILSYIFIGVVPALLILGFFLLSTGFFAGTVAAYLFRDGYEDVTRQVQLDVGSGGARDRAIAANDRRDCRSRAAQRFDVARLSDAVARVHSFLHVHSSSPCRAARGSTCAASASRRSWRRPGSRERAKGLSAPRR